MVTASAAVSSSFRHPPHLESADYPRICNVGIFTLEVIAGAADFATNYAK